MVCPNCLQEQQALLSQLERIKQAVMLKNKRIEELEHFIKKISSVAFERLSMSQGEQRDASD